MRQRFATLALAAVAAAAAAALRAAPALAQQPAADAATYPVIPRPVSLTPAAGRFTLDASTVIWTDRATAPVGRMLARFLEPATGLDIPVRTGAGTGAGRITIQRDPALAATLGPEGYRLEVRPGRVSIRAAEPAGAFYGVQSLRQLLPPQVFREAKVEGVAWTAPAVTIEDQPRFPWRGMHLDVSRHFMPKEFVKKYIDLLALQKMNSFHWHLTEDQGWRIEIRKYPLLTQVGAWRKETVVGRGGSRDRPTAYDGKRHGGFYTQEDVKEIVAYAADRFVNVVPEIEMPGHAQAAISAYPFLGVFPDSLKLEPWTKWGVTENILVPTDSTVRFMQDVLAEVLELFPSKFIHIGGDEAPKNQWKASPRVQARIRELGLKDEHEMQSWFVRQMDAWLAQRGRRLIGWDEILEGGLAPGATVMSWRGTQGGIDAARQRHDVVMTPGKPTYFDHYQSRDQAGEPLAIGGFNPLDSVYAYEPVPAELEPEFRKHVLGTQGQIWTEYIPNPKHVEYMAFPRSAALAEVGWTPASRKDYADFFQRLQVHLRRLDALDVNYRNPNPRTLTP